MHLASHNNIHTSNAIRPYYDFIYCHTEHTFFRLHFHFYWHNYDVVGCFHHQSTDFNGLVFMYSNRKKSPTNLFQYISFGLFIISFVYFVWTHKILFSINNFDPKAYMYMNSVVLSLISRKALQRRFIFSRSGWCLTSFLFNSLFAVHWKPIWFSVKWNS